MEKGSVVHARHFGMQYAGVVYSPIFSRMHLPVRAPASAQSAFALHVIVHRFGEGGALGVWTEGSQMSGGAQLPMETLVSVWSHTAPSDVANAVAPPSARGAPASSASQHSV